MRWGAIKYPLLLLLLHSAGKAFRVATMSDSQAKTWRQNEALVDSKQKLCPKSSGLCSLTTRLSGISCNKMRQITMI